ncbi:MAG: phosphate acyltransferase PlsX [Bacteroidetes bacterium]|nr:phosphate acyltransferase PlsX [Bacteroidota bacterium]
MGGDYAPQNIVLGAIDALKSDPNFELILVGKTDAIEEILKKEGFKSDRLEIIDAQEVIDMSDNPTSALKTKKNSSIVIGANLVKDKKAHAFVSAGNTGAMMAASTLLIGRIKGVARPTIGANIPNQKGRSTTLFDVGASIDSKPIHLLEQAILGSIYVEELQGIKNPTVGILSIGEEESKGNDLTFAATKLLREANINFIGNVEGRDILKGTSDIVVTDGFIGNIILKFAESIIGLLKYKLKMYAKKNLWNALRVLFAKGSLKGALQDMDYQSHGGVPLLGINGISIIGHGSSSPLAIKNMILRAKEMYDKNLIQKFEEALKNHAEK